ncbi:MAG: NUDIX domain-containing protein [Balneola sp.]
MGKKPNWLYNQSAVIPYIKNINSIDIVLVSSRSKNGWIFPKGVIEKNMTPEQSALKEAEEEAGVTGIVQSEFIDYYTYQKLVELAQYQYFL